MKKDVRIGIFLCECGKAVAGRIDVTALKEQLKKEHSKGGSVVSIQSHSRYCDSCGLSELSEMVEKEGLDRVLLGACSDRIMKKKFSAALEGVGFLDSQIELVNLKDHVALVHDEPASELTRKAAALLAGGIAGLEHLELEAPSRVRFQGPVLIVGGGIAGFQSALELARNQVESILFPDSRDPDEILSALTKKYPGSRLYLEDLGALLKEVFASPLVTVMENRPVEYLDGRTGDYRLGLRQADGSVREVSGSVVILAVDREYVSGVPGVAGIAGATGVRGEGRFSGGDAGIVDQLEFEDRLGRGEVSSGKIVFWVNGRDVNSRKVQELSALAAWQNSRFIAGRFNGAAPVVLYPDDIRLPLTGADLIEARSRGIELHTYEPDFHPVVDSGAMTFVSPRDHRSREIKWDTLVVSASLGPVTDAVASGFMRYLPVFPDETGLKNSPVRVMPEQEPVEWTILAGPAEQPCSLDEALQHGKRAARKVLLLEEKNRNGGLAAPLMSVVVDQDVCVGCGLCREICPCGAVENVRPGSMPVPRRVDPLACVGCGTCVASCPYGAMKLLNNSTQQLEAKVKAVVSRMEKTDVLAFVCGWGGQGAAELAAIRKLKYPSNLFMIPVRCLGTIDPTIVSMAFLSGANSIMLAGCPPTSSCHFGYGVDHTWFRVNVMKKLLSLCGLEPERISLGYVDVNEPEVFVEMVKSFLDETGRLGPIDREKKQKLLTAAHATLHRPRTRWVLGACLRRPSELELPEAHFDGVSFDKVVESVLKEEYLASRITAALQGSALTPPLVARALGEQTETVSPVLIELLKDGRITCREWKDHYPLYALSRPM